MSSIPANPNPDYSGYGSDGNDPTTKSSETSKASSPKSKNRLSPKRSDTNRIPLDRFPAASSPKTLKHSGTKLDSPQGVAKRTQIAVNDTFKTGHLRINIPSKDLSRDSTASPASTPDSARSRSSSAGSNASVDIASELAAHSPGSPSSSITLPKDAGLEDQVKHLNGKIASMVAGKKKGTSYLSTRRGGSWDKEVTKSRKEILNLVAQNKGLQRDLQEAKANRSLHPITREQTVKILEKQIRDNKVEMQKNLNILTYRKLTFEFERNKGALSLPEGWENNPEYGLNIDYNETLQLPRDKDLASIREELGQKVKNRTEINARMIEGDNATVARAKASQEFAKDLIKQLMESPEPLEKRNDEILYKISHDPRIKEREKDALLNEYRENLVKIQNITNKNTYIDVGMRAQVGLLVPRDAHVVNYIKNPEEEADKQMVAISKQANYDFLYCQRKNKKFNSIEEAKEYMQQYMKKYEKVVNDEYDNQLRNDQAKLVEKYNKDEISKKDYDRSMKALSAQNAKDRAEKIKAELAHVQSELVDIE